jgi:hypothetical protein
MTDAPSAGNDAEQQRLRAAIGQAVLSVAALEHVLRVVILHQKGERDGVDEELAEFMQGLADKPGGVLLQRLRSLRFDPELVERTRDVMRRRNRMVHHPAEDEPLAPGLMGQDVSTAIAHVDQIATDCDTVRTEVFAIAADGVMRASGITPEQFDEWFRTRDLDQIEDLSHRDTLAMWRHLLAPLSPHED